MVETAIDRFAIHGFDGVSTRTLAGAAGVNLPAVQYYFGSTEGLYRAAVNGIAQRVAEGMGPASARVAAALACRDLQRQKLLALLYEMLDAFSADRRRAAAGVREALHRSRRDLKIDQPQSIVEIDRDKTAELGLTMSDVGNALTAMLGGGYVNYFSLQGRSYKVIPQIQQPYRLNPDQLLNYYIRTADGTPVPLSTVARIKTQTIPESLNHFQQLNEATIQGVTAPGVALGDAIQYLQKLAAAELPQGYSIDYGGLSRQYVQESSGFVATFAFALIIIFLSLAALFESFRDPLIILVSVPMSIAGALMFIGIGVGGASLNIYTEVGLVTLMGLISKHGILIVEFANTLQQQGRSKREAIEMAAGIRLRPILMTTAAMVLGVIPLIIASGAGAVSRFDMGLVIASGLGIGTLFTLFVVPAVYLLIAADHSNLRQPEDEGLAQHQPQT